MNKPFMYLVGYNREFVKSCNTGWGCGYIAIPIEHKLAVKHFDRLSADKLKEDFTSDYVYINPYFEAIPLNQEITLTEERVINGADYLVVGFDTGHSWNNKTHNFDYVFKETAEMLKLIENY